MAKVAPLKLRRESYTKKPLAASDRPYLKVLVDNQISHLSGEYEYTLPDYFETDVEVGTLVEVPFGALTCTGLVTGRYSSSQISGENRFILKVLSVIPVICESQISLIAQVSKRYGADFFSVFRSAVPPRVISCEKGLSTGFIPAESNREGKEYRKNPIFQQLISILQFSEMIKDFVKKERIDSQILVVVPDDRDLQILSKNMKDIDHLILASTLKKSERYHNYLRCLYQNPKLILGTRSAIFTPLRKNSKIIILSDVDPSNYEKHYPNWNVRDVAILRSKESEVIFAGPSPSLEVKRLIDLGWIKERKSPSIVSSKNLRISFPTESRTHMTAIKEGLRKGHVLVNLPEAGYITSISCFKCKNIAKCDCGGRLLIDGASQNPVCVVCDRKFLDWRCNFCQGTRPYIANFGAKRLAEEVVSANPGTKTIFSKSSRRVDVIEHSSKNMLVLSTYGCEPLGRYSAYVSLRSDFLFNQIELRSYEVARNVLLSNFLMIEPDGEIYLDLPKDHPFVQSQLRKNVSKDLDFELKSRMEAELPPYTRIAVLSGPENELIKLRERMVENTLFRAPMILRKRSSNLSELIVKAKVEDSEQFSEFFQQLNKYRSLKKLPQINVRLDPFSI